MHTKDAEGFANSVDPDQTAPDLGLHCLPRPICLSENFGTLRYSTHDRGSIMLPLEMRSTMPLPFCTSVYHPQFAMVDINLFISTISYTCINSI